MPVPAAKSFAVSPLSFQRSTRFRHSSRLGRRWCGVCLRRASGVAAEDRVVRPERVCLLYKRFYQSRFALPAAAGGARAAHRCHRIGHHCSPALSMCRARTQKGNRNGSDCVTDRSRAGIGGRRERRRYPRAERVRARCRRDAGVRLSHVVRPLQSVTAIRFGHESHRQRVQARSRWTSSRGDDMLQSAGDLPGDRVRAARGALLAAGRGIVVLYASESFESRGEGRQDAAIEIAGVRVLANRNDAPLSGNGRYP